MSRATTSGINSLKQWPGDKPAMQNNIQSQQLRSSSSPAPVLIVAFCVIGLTGMGNPKAALESKAVVTVVLVRPTTGRE